MVDRLTKGPAQIFTLDVASINYAFRDLCERIDELSGLRGRAEIWDRARVDDPTVDQDALTLGAGGVTAAEERSYRYALLVGTEM